MSLEYLGSLHVDPKNLKKEPLVEYYCKTCLLDVDIKKSIDYEIQQDVKSTWSPMNKRRQNVGVIFTINSILFKYHFKLLRAHNWGLYQPYIVEHKK